MKLLLSAGLMAASLLSSPLALAQNNAEEALLERVRSGQVGDRAAQAVQVASFRRSSNAEQEQKLREARARRDELQQVSQELEETARANKKVFDKKIAELRAEMGPNAALFGSLQTLASDLVGIFRNSPTSLQYPDRQQWLTDFIARMEKSSEIFTIEELEQIWFLLQQEITFAAAWLSTTSYNIPASYASTSAE